MENKEIKMLRNKKNQQGISWKGLNYIPNLAFSSLSMEKENYM